MVISNEGVRPSEAASTQKVGWKEKIGNFFRRRHNSEEEVVLSGIQDVITSENQDVVLASSVGAEVIPTDLKQEYEARRSEVEALYPQAAYWHGTGRKQYRNGEVVDILERIIDQGGLSSQRDPFNTRTGVTQTISLSDRRMYSAGYAKMHLVEGQSLGYEYMSGEFWGIFLRNTIREAMGRTKLEGVKKLGELAWFHIKEGINPTYLLSVGRSARGWSSKVNKEKYKKPMDKVFTVHSDIPENYPILVGVKADSFSHAPVAGFIALYEVRSNNPIPFSGFTHIEVPKNQVQETEQLLAQKGVTTMPVIPMEFGEIHSSQFTPQQLIEGNPFRK